MTTPITVPMTLSVTDTMIPFTITDTSVNVETVIDVAINAVTANPYTGSYTWTPTQSRQTIQIRNKMATQDIIINPIPEYYGLITWDGATLTVS